MRADEALKKMVPPSQERPSIWRGGIIQIMVTRACDLSCHHCSQGSNLAGKPVVMTPGQFEAAVDSLEGYWGVYGVFGGNPCMSPHFEAYCEILRAKVPFEQRGLWSNSLRGKGAHARITFNPRHSNLNVHLNTDAAEEMRRDWPECAGYIKGTLEDSVHSSPWVSMEDLGVPEEERWELISRCDINRHWSALVGLIHGELRAFFCEVAYAQAALQEDDGMDTGLPAFPGWWRKPMVDFEQQVRAHCHHCGIPMRRRGQLAIGGEVEEYSATHAAVMRPKVRDRPTTLVTEIGMMSRDRPATEYLQGTTPKGRR